MRASTCSVDRVSRSGTGRSSLRIWRCLRADERVDRRGPDGYEFVHRHSSHRLDQQSGLRKLTDQQFRKRNHLQWRCRNQIDGNYAVGNNIGIGLAFCHAAVVDNDAAEIVPPDQRISIGRLRRAQHGERQRQRGIYSSDGRWRLCPERDKCKWWRRFADIGIRRLDGPSLSITSNVANANGGYGIAASSFLIDLEL